MVLAKYTTQVRSICESFAELNNSVGYNDIDNVISKAIPRIFDSKLKLYDDKYKEVLFTKILKHYYTREICEETVGLWLLRLNTRLHEILPYYNELYKSTLNEFDFLHDVDVTINRSGKTSGDTTTDKTVKDNNDIERENTDVFGSDVNDESESTSNSETTNKTSDSEYKLYSDTPQGSLQNVESEEYLTNATKQTKENNTEANDNVNATAKSKRTVSENKTSNEKITNNKTGEENSKTSITNTDEYLEHIVGKRGNESYSSMLIEFRKSIINVDMMIIEELSDLFFGLW